MAKDWATPGVDYPVVIGEREHLPKYSAMPFSEVMAAAKRGDDGLQFVQREGADTIAVNGVRNGEFALRRIKFLHNDDVAGLLYQGW